MKIFVKISITILALAGIILLIFPVSWFPSFYDVRYMGWAGIAGALIISFAPRLIRPSEKDPDFNRKKQAVALFQFFLAFIFMGNALGDLGLYKLYDYGFEYDKTLHFFTPFFGIVIISFVLSWRWGIRQARAIWIALGIIFFSSMGWEVYEVLADFFFKTHIAGVFGVNVSQDTKFDLLFDVLGLASGAAGSAYFWKYFADETNIKKREITRGVVLVFILAIAIGLYASYMKM